MRRIATAMVAKLVMVENLFVQSLKYLESFLFPRTMLTNGDRTQTEIGKRYAIEEHKIVSICNLETGAGCFLILYKLL